MQRRTVLRGVAVGSAAGVAGCFGLLGDDCGPGEDSIEDVADDVEPAEDGGDDGAGNDTADEEAAEVSLKGEIKSASEDEIVIDDTTGQARLETIGGFMLQNIEGGECAFAEGIPYEPEDDEVDVAVFVTGEIGLEENE